MKAAASVPKDAKDKSTQNYYNQSTPNPKKYSSPSTTTLILSNLKIYSVIHERLNKKGYIKKLLDNLTSHRTKIAECLQYNLTLATQSQKI